MGARREERGWRRRVGAGVAVSAAAHAAILGLARWEGGSVAGPADALRLVSVAEEVVEPPLEVIRIRETPAPAAAPAGGVASLSAPPVRMPVPAALAAAIPSPRLLLQKVRTEDEEEPAVSYASVEDLLIRRGPNPQALRPIDDRPIEVLAAIARAEGRRGGGIRVGGSGGTCE